MEHLSPGTAFGGFSVFYQSISSLNLRNLTSNRNVLLSFILSGEVSLSFHVESIKHNNHVQITAGRIFSHRGVTMVCKEKNQGMYPGLFLDTSLD